MCRNTDLIGVVSNIHIYIYISMKRIEQKPKPYMHITIKVYLYIHEQHLEINEGSDTAFFVLQKSDAINLLHPL